MDSLWQLDGPHIPTDPFPVDRRFDLAVVGAGIAGLTAALMFARSGMSVVVLEARDVGAGTTGHSSAKVSQLQGTLLQRIKRRNTAGVLGAYVQSQAAAFEWLMDFTAETGVAVERRAAFTYAATPEGRAQVEAEFVVGRDHGLPVDLVEDAGLPFRTFGAARLADQAQLDPMELLAALAREFRVLGGVIVTGARVNGVRASKPARVRAELTSGTPDDRDVRELDAERVLIATGTPILDRGLYFAKLAAKRSYAQAWEVDGDQLPDGMFLGVEEPTRSVRTASGSGGRMLLLTGGNGHGVGRHPSPQRASDELADWTTSHWPEAQRVAAWSAQDWMTPHGVPFVGWLPRGRGRVYLATGFSKWGMTNAVATALTLVADIQGDNTGWQKVLHRRPTLPPAIAVGIGENAAVASWYARGWARALATPLGSAPLEGDGEVGRRGLVPVAASTVQGVTTEVCAVCPHLGAVVTWNDFERNWDCPAHGSRFAPDGSVLEGPAKRGLSTRP
jgi:glycine/D-amino acid oxidase-like deaminating enzyme